MQEVKSAIKHKMPEVRCTDKQQERYLTGIEAKPIWPKSRSLMTPVRRLERQTGLS